MYLVVALTKLLVGVTKALLPSYSIVPGSKEIEEIVPVSIGLPSFVCVVISKLPIGFVD